MSNTQLYFAIAVPAFLYLIGFTFTVGLEKRIDELSQRMDDMREDIRDVKERLAKLEDGSRLVRRRTRRTEQPKLSINPPRTDPRSGSYPSSP